MLVVDVQRGLVEGAAAVPDADTFVAGLAAFLERARLDGVPIVHLQDEGTAPDSPIRRGTEGWELALAVGSGEVVLSKSDDDGFRGTGLHDTLQARGADRLIVVGIQSEMCVAATARGALDRGYTVVMPREGHTTYDVPDDDAGGPAVPAALVARVAEWSLGDAVELPQTLDDVTWS